MKRRYDATFYAVKAQDGVSINFNYNESDTYVWISPIDALNESLKGSMKISSPVEVVLWQMAHLDNISDFLTLID